jgi:ubiquinone/menaquinone biosynthesis C-methylase UbiE
MDVNDAVALIRDAVGSGTGVWADLGSGTGTFSRALARILDAESTIYAVDDDVNAVAALRRLAATSPTRIVPVKADFTRSLAFPGLGAKLLDGILLANSLHFVTNPERVLMQLARCVRVGGRGTWNDTSGPGVFLLWAFRVARPVSRRRSRRSRSSLRGA